MDQQTIHILAIASSLLLGSLFVFGWFIGFPVVYSFLPSVGSWTTLFRRVVPGGRLWRQRNIQSRGR